MFPKEIEGKGAKIDTIFSYNWSIPRKEPLFPPLHSWITKERWSLYGNKNILMLNDIKIYFSDLDSKLYVLFYSFYFIPPPTVLLYLSHHLIISAVKAFFIALPTKQEWRHPKTRGQMNFWMGFCWTHCMEAKVRAKFCGKQRYFCLICLVWRFCFLKFQKLDYSKQDES